MRRHAATVALALGLALAACEQAPPAAPESPSSPLAPLAAAQGVTKLPIEGVIASLGTTQPNVRSTPSGRCHLTDYFNTGQFTSGDLEGSIQYHYHAVNLPCVPSAGPGSRLTASGPIEGEITFRGKTGPVSGHWSTECRPGETLSGLSCDGVYNLRGSGELEGVRFHVVWGPGWWPFSYSGTVSSH